MDRNLYINGVVIKWMDWWIGGGINGLGDNGWNGWSSSFLPSFSLYSKLPLSTSFCINILAYSRWSVTWTWLRLWQMIVLEPLICVTEHNMYTLFRTLQACVVGSMQFTGLLRCFQGWSGVRWSSSGMWGWRSMLTTCGMWSTLLPIHCTWLQSRLEWSLITRWGPSIARDCYTYKALFVTWHSQRLRLLYVTDLVGCLL